MNFILEVHDGGERAAAGGGASVRRRSQPQRQRPVQSHVEHVKPEGLVCPTLEPRDAVSSSGRVGRRTGRRADALRVRPVFGLSFVEARFCFSAAGTVVSERAVAARDAATVGRRVLGRGDG